MIRAAAAAAAVRRLRACVPDSSSLARFRRSAAARAARRVPAALLSSALLVALAACQPAVLDPAGPVGRAEKQILIGSVVIMLAIVVPTIVATLAFAWWFRASNAAKARYQPDWAYSGQIELVTWAVPLLTIMLLGGVAWIGSHQLDPGRPLDSAAATAADPAAAQERQRQPPLDVQVVSLDWKWLFILPEQRIASVNRLVIPAGRPIRFSLTSASVMNSFFVPQLGSMIYTMNGMATQLNLQADRPGAYRGLSTHLSGDGFSDMHFEVEAVPPDRFAAWVETTRGAATGPTLDPGSYARLAEQSAKVAPFTYREADPDLFHKVVMQELPPGPGPRTGQPNPGVSPRQAAEGGGGGNGPHQQGEHR